MTVATKIALFNSLSGFWGRGRRRPFLAGKNAPAPGNPETKFAGLEKNANWWGVWETVVMLPAMIVRYYMVFKPI
ncbi:MAG: hypothetical protein IPH12_14780 [Saprospirales bacterium]|nr:hypothetical protein [Saprospirales bacterium]